MSIKALFKIIGVRTSISHINLISHLIFPATMWDRYYIMIMMIMKKKKKKSKGRKVR